MAKPDATPCDDGNACTQNDTCQAGVCTGANPVTCATPDQCHIAGACNPSTGACSNPAKPDATPCDDGNACTQTDSCQAGICTGANPVTCTASDQCHDPGTCNTVTGVCSNPAKTGPAACIDDLIAAHLATLDDTCSTITPMGKHFETLAQTPIPAQKFVDLNDATKQPEMPIAGDTFTAFTITNLYPSPSGDPRPSDANQGDILDCPAIADMASLAYLAPGFIKSIITDNANNTYSVVVYDPTGTARTVRVDNQFLTDSSGTLRAVRAKDGTPNWSTVLEKAIMKYIKYFPVVPQMAYIGSEFAAPILTGDGCSFAFGVGQLTHEDLTRAVTVSLAHGKIVICGFHDGGIRLGNASLYTAHAWSAFVPPNPATMITMRNPYGQVDLVGGGSDSSADGVLDVPPLSMEIDGSGFRLMDWTMEVDLRINYPGAAGTAGRTTPYVYP